MAVPIPDLNITPESPIPDLNISPASSISDSHDAGTTMKKRLKISEKKNIAHLLSLNYNDSKLKRVLISKLSLDYGVSRFTVGKIWKGVLKAIKEDVVPDMGRKYKGGGRRYALDLEKVRLIPLHLRTNIRTLAKQLGASKSTVHRLVQKGEIRSHSNALKPFLTPSNMEARVKFVLNHIERSTLHTNPTFVGMFLVVHIDEKWFYMTRQTQKYYLLPNEQEPHRTSKSKRFITKIMFMSAIARPRFNEDGLCVFDGKAPNTVCELVDAVLKAYEEVTHTTLNYVWLSLMNCMTEILKNGGNNNYKLPHMGKEKLQNLGQLPSQITISRDLVQGILNGTWNEARNEAT